MTKITREYYPITEAARIAACSVPDLVNLAAKGDIRFIVLTAGLLAQQVIEKNIAQTYEYIKDKFCYVRQDSVAIFEANHSNDSLYIEVVHTDADLENGWRLHESSWIPMTNESLYMLTVDINALMDDSIPNDDSGYKPRCNGYKERDVFAIKLIEKDPNLLTMRSGQIKTILEQQSTLFISGYEGWWRDNPIFPKSKAGRPKRS